jgi:hypothetical protein
LLGAGGYTCNPNYSGGRAQKDDGSKPAWANNSQDPVSKNALQKRTSGVTQAIGLRSSPSTITTKKKKKMHYAVSMSLNGFCGFLAIDLQFYSIMVC